MGCVDGGEWKDLLDPKHPSGPGGLVFDGQIPLEGKTLSEMPQAGEDLCVFNSPWCLLFLALLWPP